MSWESLSKDEGAVLDVVPVALGYPHWLAGSLVPSLFVIQVPYAPSAFYPVCSRGRPGRIRRPGTSR